MTQKPPDEARVRATLAIIIVSLSVAGASVASAVYLVTAPDAAAKAEAGRLIFASILPLFGTWVGTVLAFYYARDNLQAATESTLRLRADPDASTPVDQIMIPASKIDATRLAAGQDPRTLLLSDISQSMISTGRQRWPIFDHTDVVFVVVHRSTLDAFTQASPALAAGGTLGQLADDPALGPLIGALGFVGVRDRLDRARTAMRSVKNCNDVFATSTGDKPGVVFGWITNTMLAERD